MRSAELPISRVLFPAEQIAERVDALADEVSAAYAATEGVVLVGVLKGAFIFLADLARRLTIPRRVEFIAVASYDRGAVSGAIRLEMDVRHPLEGRHVLVVEDIVDSGQTLRYLMELLASHGAASVRSCVLLRRETLAPELQPDYVGFSIAPDLWVVGYGLDYAEQHRTLPYIGVVEAGG